MGYRTETMLPWGRSGEVSLSDKAEELRREMGLKEGLPIAQVVDETAVQLGLTAELEGMRMIDKVDACLKQIRGPIGHGAGVLGAVPVPMAMAMPVMAQDVNLVPMGTAVPIAIAPVAPMALTTGLQIHEARYGWAVDIWSATLGSGRNHGGGAKDVTDTV